MHPVRRRKKRPNYGVRTVELSRGKNGFGFTISGQQPCILSCIVAGSPAENAGLRAGDYLVAVEGQSVSKVPHDDVVRLIGASTGILKLQIAENYYSDSSDDDVVVTARQKPKYPHKPRNNAPQNSRSATGTQQSRAAKVVRDLRTGAMFEEQVVLPTDPKVPTSPLRSIKLLSLPDLSLHQWKPPSHLAPLSRIVLPSRPTPNDLVNRETVEEEPIYQAIISYLGTIEMPRKLPPGSRLQIVRGCIKRLRAEKRSHTAVLMSVYNQRLKLTNNSGQTLAVYPADRVTFCGASSEEDRRHFGIVTTSADEDPSNSCHVFAVDPRPHAEHVQRAQTFKLDCHVEPSTGLCREFPQNCDPIITPIRVFYETGARQNEIDEPVMANSPQPSNDSTTTTSNSDSGIGFRDDCGNQSDRILVVDVQNQRLHIQQVDESDQPTRRVSTVQCERLTVRAMPDPVVPSSNRSQSSLSTSSDSPEVANENMSVSSGATKSPDNTMLPFDGNNTMLAFDGNNTMLAFDDNKHSSDIASAGLIVFKGVDLNTNRSTDEMSLGSARSQDALMSYKLSPKVFNVPHVQPTPTSHSLEDLKVSEQNRELNAASLNRSQWGSLQELRSFVSDCFESSTVGLVQNLHEDPDTGVSCWASSFEKLLDDPDGLQTFAEFLKKEFSHENIYFWVACERYRWLESVEARREAAHHIFETHLAVGASEPVNVDSQARQVSQEELNEAQPSLFLQAQKQICNLMKFDSYPRFIKSELYKECLLRDISGQPLPLRGKPDANLQLHQNPPLHQSLSTNLKKSRSDAEERRRKSLLPWSRKTRSKSRDLERSDAESISSSRSSLASWDLPLGPALCRVVLPDGATAVVPVQPPQTVGQLVVRLLDKRALRYNHFQVFFGQSNKAVSLEEDAAMLGGQEVRVEDTVVFRLDLPNRKTVVVKPKQGKTLAQVLRPILHKYGYRLEMITLCLMSENEVIEPSALVSTVNNQRLQVLTRSTPTECAHLGWRVGECHSKAKPPASLDEITNRVFEELLQGKAENLTQASDQGSVRSEDWGSEDSSGILGRFLRRDSAFLDKHRDGRHKIKKVAKYSTNADEPMRAKPTLSKLPPLIAKWKPAVKLEGRSESDVLYEGLKRAQRSRLEDQRGTEINFELPDFLKDKENAPESGKKVRKLRRETESTGNSKFYPSAQLSQASSQESLSVDRSFSSTNGIIPTNEAAEEYFLGPADRTQTPPPLPPKPKHLPTATSWPSQNQPCRVRRTVYLDQPSSSFV